MRKFSKSVVAAAVLTAAALSGCNSSDSDGSSPASFTLGVTDAPVDQASKVVVQFTGVEIQPEDGQRISIDYSEPKQIDLLALQGGLRELLFDGEALAAGKYSWIRLKVNAEPGVRDSYIVVNDAEHELRIPSGAQTGLKLNNSFTLTEGVTTDLTIDFDLRKSVNKPNGTADGYGDAYRLRPTLRLVATDSAGSVAGVLDPTVFASVSCESDSSYAVYLFEGQVTAPDDVDDVDPNPIATANLALDEEGSYRYRLAYLQPADYLLSATCRADLDDPETDDAIEFVATQPVTVSGGNETVVDVKP